MLSLSVLIALLEILGVSLLLHTILSILKPSFVGHNVFTSLVYNMLQVQSYQQFVLVITILLFIGYLCKNVILVQINKVQVRLAYEITNNLSSKHYKHIANQDYLYFKSRKSAEIINELFSLTVSFSESILITSIMLLSEFFVVAFILAAILIYKPLLFLFTFATVLPVAGVLVYMNRESLGRYGKKVHKSMPHIYENISELTLGIAQIKLWNAASQTHASYQNIKEDVYRLQAKISMKSKHIPTRIYEVIAVTGILCVVLFGVLGDLGSSAMISAISIYAGVSFRLLPSMNKIISSFNAVYTHQHLLDYLEDTTELPRKNTAFMDLVLNKGILMDNVSFKYGEGDWILRNASLSIQKGDFIGIIGASGSGKSTLVNILCSLVPPTEGDMRVDNELLKEDDLASYRYLFSYVKQDVFMQNTSIAKNVALFSDELDEQRVMECLAQVNLQDWVLTLPQGVNTAIGEVGNNISGGQRQRIALARALYKKAEIFIFDEMTNNLDKHSKEQTLLAISELKKQGKTALFVTHKEDELELCNKVYSLQDKKLVQVK